MPVRKDFNFRIIVQVFIPFAPDYYTIEPVLFESEVDNRHCVSLQLVFCRVVFSGTSCRSIINCWDDFVALGSWKGGRSPDLFDRRRQYRGRKIPASAGRGQGGGGYSSFRKDLMPGGAGGPGALQTSPPARRRKSVDTNPHAALAGLTCRASPANSSVAGAATLDSVRLRRNRSLLLCGTQSSPLTCARGADRACTREKAGIPWKFHSRRCPRLRGRGPSRRDMLRGACRAWAREKAGMSWKFHSQCKKTPAEVWGDSAGARPPREEADGTERRESVRSGEGKKGNLIIRFFTRNSSINPDPVRSIFYYLMHNIISIEIFSTHSIKKDRSFLYFCRIPRKNRCSMPFFNSENWKNPSR